ncbi:type III-A CRISPR-associated protein Csm2 [Marinitoga sp. 1155]|uniref:type III-A CRISPR-associated protein Csm2 n=1 Tax=Marinitoga sp. 1155 TaxID=1428448 RepID=UPI000640C032|nr:type III-A CRISPR-associated protein Csm2 [Marinitoga sp. 1155]KLO23502.1 hypothetical protein X274_06305 [Marinitoga sp. 1155]
MPGRNNSNNFDIVSELKKIEGNEKRNLSDFLKPEKYATTEGIAYKYANFLKNKIKTVQIRNVFATLKEFEQANRGKAGNEFDDSKKYILLTQTAYAVGRKVVPKNFYKFMEYCIERINSPEDLEVFVKFFETIIAYFKYLEIKNQEG